MAATVSGDAFAQLNRTLEAPHAAAGSIRKSCAAVEDCISSSRDNLRAFFEACLPTLLRRVFGYDQDTCWLNAVTKAGREADAAALLALLSPTGRFFAAIQSADADQLVQFMFPLERLPLHTQELLKSTAGRQELERWPQYTGRISVDSTGRTMVCLNLYEYFMFWNAFFVLRSNTRSSPAGGAAGGGAAGYLMRSSRQPGEVSGGWQDVGGARGVAASLVDLKRSIISGLHGGSTISLDAHPYFALLAQYLSHFLQRNASQTQVPAFSGGTPGFFTGLGSPQTALPGAPPTPGQVLLSVLVEFWMTDVAEPLPEAPPTTDMAVGAGNASSTAAAGVGVGARVASPDVRRMSFSGPSPGLTPSLSPRLGAAPQPAPTVTPASRGASNPLRVLAYQPPCEEMLLGITQLLRHIFVIDSPDGPSGALSRGPGGGVGGSGAARPAQGGTPWLVETPIRTAVPLSLLAQRSPPVPPPVGVLGGSACGAVQAVSRKAYRLLRRGIAQWPQVPPGVSLSPLVTTWLTILTPWNPPSALAVPSASHRGAHGTAAGGGTAAGHTAAGLQSPLPTAHTPGSGQKLHPWEGMSHLGSEISQRLSLRGGTPEPASTVASQARAYNAAWRGHVLAHLPFYTLLIPRFLELALGRMAYRGDATATELLLLLRPLAAGGREFLKLLQDAELAYNRYCDSGRKRVSSALAEVVPWLLDQAGDWEAAAVAGAPTNPPLQVDTEYQLFTLGPNSAASFGAAIIRAAQTQVRPDLRDALVSVIHQVLPVDSMPDNQPAVRAVAEPAYAVQYPRAGAWQRVQYKGDWLSRPIASNEIGVLVRVTVSVSRVINRLLGLDVPWRGDDREEPPETVVHQVLVWARKRNYRVSLRFLAEVQVLGWLFVLYWVLRFAAAIWAA